MPKADRQATEARQFKDERSFVWKDGREQLYGADWDERRFELLQRSRGQCENVILGRRCLREAADPHHKTLRSIARDDRLEALLAVCRRCHTNLDYAQRQQKRDARYRARVKA